MLYGVAEGDSYADVAGRPRPAAYADVETPDLGHSRSGRVRLDGDRIDVARRRIAVDRARARARRRLAHGRRACQSASNFDPRSASKIDPLLLTGRRRRRSPRRIWSGLRSRGERGLAQLPQFVCARMFLSDFCACSRRRPRADRRGCGGYWLRSVGNAGVVPTLRGC